MQKIIPNVALLASLAALTAGLWQDWGAWLTVKHMVISYLAFYFCGLVLFLVFRAVPVAEKDPGRAPSRGPVGK